MKTLEEKILRDGTVLPGNILKVDNFVNHMIEPKLFMEMADEFYEKFKDEGITKILIQRGGYMLIVWHNYKRKKYKYLRHKF